MAANVPVLTFNVILEGYACLTIEDVRLTRFGGLPFEPPPLNDPYLKTRPSATAAGSAKGANPQAGGVNVPEQVIANSWGGWMTAVWDMLRQLRAGNAVTFEAPSVDETDIDWFGFGTIDASTDPVTFTPDLVGTSRFGRDFEVGDYILWNNPDTFDVDYGLVLPLPRRSYEIDKITAINNGVFTLQRHERGKHAREAHFGSLIADQPGRNFYRLIDKVWTVQIYQNKLPQVIKFPWDNMLVCAVIGTPSGGTPVLQTLIPIDPQAGEDPPCPGLRTLNGAQYNLGTLGTLSVGATSDKRIKVAGPESIRNVFCDIDTIGTNTIWVVYINGDFDRIALIDAIGISNGERFSYVSAARRQMPYHTGWPPYVPPTGIGKFFDWPPNILPVITGQPNSDGKVTSGALDPTQYLAFVEGGWIDYFIKAGGSGTGLGVTVQT